MQKLIVANWKSNKSLVQAQEWLTEVSQLWGDQKPTSALPIVAPPTPLLIPVGEALQSLGWPLAAQDLSPLPAGSYTGAVSGTNLQGLNVSYVIIGHSERRRYFHETPQEVAKKVEQALDVKLTPIVCVDEQTVEAQAATLGENLTSRCVVAYEPRGAIGTGDNVSLSVVEEFKQKVQRLFGAVPFLYGGSVDELNVAEYLLDTDGVLIGSASLSAAQFVKILQAAQGHSAVSS